MQRQAGGLFDLPDVSSLVQKAISSNPIISTVAKAATGIKTITEKLGTVKQDIISQVQTTVKDQVQTSLSESGITPGSGTSGTGYGSGSNYGSAAPSYGSGGGRRSKTSKRKTKKTRKMKRKFKRGSKRRQSR